MKILLSGNVYLRFRSADFQFSSVVNPDPACKSCNEKERACARARERELVRDSACLNKRDSESAYER